MVHHDSSASLQTVTSVTTVLAVIGDPIRHSKSPVMHNAALQARGWDGIYTAFHVAPERLAEAIHGIRALGIRGINVTIPHKERVMAYLDEVHESARMIGAVNTIVNDNNRLIGYNTDGLGYVRSLKEETAVDLSECSVLIVGAGGAARGLAYALLREGCGKLLVANRTLDRAEKIAQEMSSLGAMECVGIQDGIPAVEPERVDVVINTTSVGMHPHIGESPIAEQWLKSHMIVSDIIYNPLETKLLQAAKAAGAKTHGGLGMFVYQGAIAFELWTGEPAPIEVMRESVLGTVSS
ncbi:shikimate dehydrogenase [Paenibacillus sp. ACRRX]|uniref:shikimate dehydrogenase n=1 Tax=unclassified Paenibacillus TaxID=185978 RepID=UPI001EF5FB6E|nr:MULTISPECIES: shikimate dehydrogenase [unclassified Paenibacillus]MCG7407902.1 shikimate dehydrogenase [Paenibacillus sp. ACRRX]MDK8181045.1 shikimate dehydrogenase [Paenibacillus sp. UMB4589-SE434]